MVLLYLMTDGDPIGEPIGGLLVLDQGATLVMLAIVFTLLVGDGRRSRLPMDCIDIGNELIHCRSCL